MKRAVLLAVLVAIGGLSLTVAAYQGQQRPRAKTPEIRNIKDNLYVIGGSEPEDQTTFTGGNTLVWITANGVVLVDTKNPSWGQMILDKVKTVTNKPVTMVLNSHGHSDHAGSNVELASPPTVEYIVQENIRTMWAKESCNSVGNCTRFKGENAKYLPKKTFKDKLSILDGKDRIELYYFGRGHTNGDTWIVFPSVRTMHIGDLYHPKVPPFIDVENGGSGVEFPETLAKGVAAITGVDRVVPGHSEAVMTWDDLKMHRDYMKHFVTFVQNGIKAGKSADEIGKAYMVPVQFKGYMEGRQNDRKRAADDIKIVYDEIKKR
jgi:cyclase